MVVESVLSVNGMELTQHNLLLLQTPKNVKPWVNSSLLLQRVLFVVA